MEVIDKIDIVDKINFSIFGRLGDKDLDVENQEYERIEYSEISHASNVIDFKKERYHENDFRLVNCIK